VKFWLTSQAQLLAKAARRSRREATRKRTYACAARHAFHQTFITTLRRHRLTRCVSFYYKEVAMSGDHLGRFEHFLLLAVMRLGDQAYGMTIRRELAEHTGRDIAVGAIYTALARLERRGLVQSWLGQPTAERGGKAKRHYRVLGSGRKALDRAEAALTGLSQDLRRAPKRS
jgi:PadR family transcriptional regulator PadR